jgi:hypothetical protein
MRKRECCGPVFDVEFGELSGAQFECYQYNDRSTEDESHDLQQQRRTGI